MTVSLADVSTRLQFSGEKEAEKYIRDMVWKQHEQQSSAGASYIASVKTC